MGLKHPTLVVVEHNPKAPLGKREQVGHRTCWIFLVNGAPPLLVGDGFCPMDLAAAGR